MILCSALYYPGSLDHPESLIRDNRWYPGKAVQAFPVWWSYVRRHYPDVPVYLFADTASPVPVRPLLDALPEAWIEACQPPLERWQLEHGEGARVQVRWLSEHSGKYFWPMQRNLVEAIKLAYHLNEDLFWLDADAFLNTDIRPLVAGYDAAAPELAHHQYTMDSVCTYISAARLHALDKLGIDLPSFLTTMLADGPTETRMHTLQEGGLYKLFGYGRTRVLGGSIELSHLSCYDHFVAFLGRNPLNTIAYERLLDWLPTMAQRARVAGAEMVFHDMDYRIGGAV